MTCMHPPPHMTCYFSPERGNEQGYGTMADLCRCVCVLLMSVSSSSLTLSHTLQAYGAMADMWALGVMLIELVTLTRQTRS
jgi:hypothetical protein